MHELSVATDIAQSAFGAAEGRRLERLTLQNGTFSSVSSESLRFYLEILTEEHEGRQADIVIQEVKARCTCECGESYETDRFLNPCPKCGGWKRKVESGLECRLESIEVADKTPTQEHPHPPQSSQSTQSSSE
jgi:hydrogenase nickel incorporation protein HypA/HybF